MKSLLRPIQEPVPIANLINEPTLASASTEHIIAKAKTEIERLSSQINNLKQVLAKSEKDLAFWNSIVSLQSKGSNGV